MDEMVWKDEMVCPSELIGEMVVRYVSEGVVMDREVVSVGAGSRGTSITAKDK